MLAPNYRGVKLIVFSIFCTSAIGSALLHLTKYGRDESHVIDTIIQTGPSKEALATLYFTELLDLSRDEPTYAASFSVEEAHQKLLETSLFKEVFIEKRCPSTLYIDYTVRKPVALLADYTNTAIDEESNLFPLEPFFSPKKLPEIYLGLTEYTPFVDKKELRLAFEIIHFFHSHTFLHEVAIKRVDTSRAYADSFGKREIVVVLEKQERSHFLRLSTRDYLAGLTHYLQMKEDKLQDEVIDLRIPNIAYVEEI